MTYVVTEACINCKHTDCVEVCPVDAFHEGANFLVIHPDECIDCGVCVPECPVEAIYADADVPAGLEQYVALNAELAKDWPAITRKVEPLPEASHWASVRDKLPLLRRA
ncbi:MAG: ferredoxin family protein [Betaproteobacteria bacterium]|nr:ferredoxin family protein [Betaproteobacteria bacterium]